MEIEEDEDLTEMALPQDTEEEKKSATDKLKSFFGRSTKKTEKPKKGTRKTKKPKSKKSPKGKPSRVSALANRRRK